MAELDDIAKGIGGKALQFIRFNPIVGAISQAVRSTPIANTEITAQDILAFEEEKKKSQLPVKPEDEQKEPEQEPGGPKLPEVINWLSYLDNEAFKKKTYNSEDYIDAGQGSNIRAYVSMLPGDAEIKAKDLLGELRRLGSEKYNETPFGKFYNPAELRESGMEYQLLKLIDQDPNASMGKKDYLKMLTTMDPKTSYTGFQNKISTTDTLLQNYRVAIENIGNLSGGTKEFKDAKFKISSGIEDQFQNFNTLMRNLDDTQKTEVIKGKIMDLGKPIYDMIKSNYKEIRRLEQNKLPFLGKKTKIAYLETVNQELNRLLGVTTSMANNLGFDTPVQQNLSAGQSSYSLAGGQNYRVKGLTFKPREVAGFTEGVRGSTHFSDKFGGIDTFHVRVADYKDASGEDVTILQEVQSDQEEPRRKEQSYQDPVADLKINKLNNEMLSYSQKVVMPEMQKRNIPDYVLEQIENVYQSATDNFNTSVKRAGKGKIVNFPNLDAEVMKMFDTQVANGVIDNKTKDAYYKFYKKIKPLYTQYKIPMNDLTRKSGGSLSTIMPFASNPSLYAEKALWEESLDSLKKGIKFLSWLPGEVQTQIQHGGYNPEDYTDTEKILRIHEGQAQGHFNFYGSMKNPENNTMYKAAEKVIQKYDNLAEILGWENYVSPKLYAQGNNFLNLASSQFGEDSQLSQNQTRGKNPGIKQGYAFIDFSPMIESLSTAEKKKLFDLKEEGKLPSYKQGGQIESPSLVSLDEVINGYR